MKFEANDVYSNQKGEEEQIVPVKPLEVLENRTIDQIRDLYFDEGSY